MVKTSDKFVTNKLFLCLGGSMNNGIPNQPDPFPITADVLLNFTVYVEVDEANSSHVLKGRLQNYFGKAFAEKLMISHDRISDVNVVYAGNETFNTEVCKGYHYG